ncbi:MAG TPA: cbb3-type cytochrome oxidase assembly protein CcoS [Gemmatimonadales bacterium]|nr:cbb3-type cytochrome oxidase assembly protein CcoS [Gemmatimonadales bacterium]
MRAIAFLIPVVLGLGLVFGGMFIHAARTGQFDDLDDPPKRMLKDD